MSLTEAEGRSDVPPAWIHSKVTLEEIEGPRRARDLISPGDGPEWRAFKRRLREKDELWYFTTPSDFFMHSAGRMGYVILRRGKQVAHFVAIMT